MWIAPFMVGNRSGLYREHPDWVVQDRQTGGPLAQMRFYGEFRWHKRSEEYYVLDIKKMLYSFKQFHSKLWLTTVELVDDYNERLFTCFRKIT